MPYDCTTLPRENKSVGRCPSGGSGTLESLVCMCTGFGSSSRGRFLCVSLTNMIRGRVSPKSEVEGYCPRKLNRSVIFVWLSLSPTQTATQAYTNTNDTNADLLSLHHRSGWDSAGCKCFTWLMTFVSLNSFVFSVLSLWLELVLSDLFLLSPLKLSFTQCFAFIFPQLLSQVSQTVDHWCPKLVYKEKDPLQGS